MHLDNVGVVIAARSFDLVGGKKVTLTFGKPQPFPENRDYYCPYRISGIGSGEVRYAAGVDSLQALLMALKLADVGMRSSQGIPSWRIDLGWIGGRRSRAAKRGGMICAAAPNEYRSRRSVGKRLGGVRIIISRFN
jgi:hypothetical protein